MQKKFNASRFICFAENGKTDQCPALLGQCALSDLMVFPRRNKAAGFVKAAMEAEHAARGAGAFHVSVTLATHIDGAGGEGR